MSGAAFGLYPSRALVPGQRLAAGAAVALNTPVDAGGVKLFRVSYWLPVAAPIATAKSLRLATGALQLRFTPARFDVPLSDRTWFTRVGSEGSDRLRIEFAWPATLVRVPTRRARDRYEIKLFRADGDAVAAEPTQAGSTGADLDPPWVGSPLVIEVGAALPGLDTIREVGGAGKARGAAGSASGLSEKGVVLAAGGRNAVNALTLAGRPTSPRMSLLAERGESGVLLWQALLPGEHDTATLPARPLADEWSGALAQVLALAADPLTRPERLRLDVESDAPCHLAFSQLELALHADLELLAKPQRLDFSGDRSEQVDLALALPAGLPPGLLRLSGRVVADAQASAESDAAPPDARQGALLLADRAAVQPIDLAQPASVGGLAIDWQPLSSSLRLRLRLLADGGAGPGARVLVEQTRTFETPAAGWVALRWSAFDLQSQRVWVEASVLQGAGLWLFADGSSAAGWTETTGVATQRDALPRGLRTALLAPAPPDMAARAISVGIDGHTFALTLDAGALALDIPADLVPLLAVHAIAFAGSVRASVTVESALLEVTP
jgi:hypothetical protein